ncbi:MAG TPA: high-potential iron-sulfur protein [Pseudomonadales bacterium]|nr:high-potential iron-sulfur protein [Pseudomonadales bacterium]
MAQLSRRSFLRGAVATAALIPLVQLDTRSAMAAERVTMDDATAKALGYVEDASQANRTAKAGVAAEDQLCSTCALYMGTGETGPCTLFQGREVVAGGWCSAWVPKG